MSTGTLRSTSCWMRKFFRSTYSQRYRLASVFASVVSSCSVGRVIRGTCAMTKSFRNCGQVSAENPFLSPQTAGAGQRNDWQIQRDQNNDDNDSHNDQNCRL